VDSLKKEYDSWVALVKTKIMKLISLNEQAFKKREEFKKLESSVKSTEDPRILAARDAYTKTAEEIDVLFNEFVRVARAALEPYGVVEALNAIIEREGNSVARWTSVELSRILKSSMGDLDQAAATNKSLLDQAKGGIIPEAGGMGNSKIEEGLTRLRSIVETTMDNLSFTASFSKIASGKPLEEVSFMENNFAFPPMFSNEDLISVDTSDKFYNELLGARKLFSDLSRDANVEDLPVMMKGIVEGNLAVAIKNRQAYSKFVKFLFALNKIFPIDGKKTGTMWEERSISGERFDSVRDWEERDILRREHLQSLGEFLTVNRLKLTKDVSDFPTPTPFYVLRPEADPTKINNPDGRELSWDDTIFSRVVDEFRIQSRTIKTDAGTIEQLMDPEILKLRKSVRDPYLTTKVRQELIVAYARKHFGARAHDGT
jgi:hypothetical protein